MTYEQEVSIVILTHRRAPANHNRDQIYCLLWLDFNSSESARKSQLIELGEYQLNDFNLIGERPQITTEPAPIAFI